MTGATSTSLTVSITGLSSVSNGTTLHLAASVTVDGVNSGSGVPEVATVRQRRCSVSTPLTPTPSGVVVTFNGSPINANTTISLHQSGRHHPWFHQRHSCRRHSGNVAWLADHRPIKPRHGKDVRADEAVYWRQITGYTLTSLRNAVQAVGGATLGANYSTTFTVTSTSTPVLSVPSFARGPGQTVAITDTLGCTRPVSR